MRPVHAMTPPTPATALTPEHLAAAREQAGSALAGCAWCQVPHKAPNDAMHRPVPYDLTVPASEMLELLDHIAALEARAIEPAAPEEAPMSGEMTAWGIEWNGRLYWHTDLSRYGHFALFRTRREARQAIEADWSFLRERPDLRTEPHRWRMPRAVRVSVEVVR